MENTDTGDPNDAVVSIESYRCFNHEAVPHFELSRVECHLRAISNRSVGKYRRLVVYDTVYSKHHKVWNSRLHSKQNSCEALIVC